jgi:hypothetical protein
MHHEEGMNIRKFKDSDRSSLIELWNSVFPDDPPHNEPSIVIDAKLTVDDLIFVAEHESKLVGACMAGYIQLLYQRSVVEMVLVRRL